MCPVANRALLSLAMCVSTSCRRPHVSVASDSICPSPARHYFSMAPLLAPVLSDLPLAARKAHYCRPSHSRISNSMRDLSRGVLPLQHRMIFGNDSHGSWNGQGSYVVDARGSCFGQLIVLTPHEGHLRSVSSLLHYGHVDTISRGQKRSSNGDPDGDMSLGHKSVSSARRRRSASRQRLASDISRCSFVSSVADY